MLLEFIRMMSTFKPDFRFQVIVNNNAFEVKKVYEMHQTQMVVLASPVEGEKNPEIIMGVGIPTTTIVLPSPWKELYQEFIQRVDEKVQEKNRLIESKVPKRLALHLDAKELYETFYDTLASNPELAFRLFGSS